MDVRWLWIFVDAVALARRQWDFWRAVTRADFSPLRGDRGQFATLVPGAGDPWVKVQEVTSGGGVHLDLDVADVAAAAEFARGLGGEVVHRYEEGTVVVMRSPGDFVFCLTTWGGASEQVRGDQVDLLDQVCLDVPPGRYDSEVTFWSALLGLPEAGSLPEFTALPRPAGQPVRVQLQRRTAGDGPVTGHLDLASADRAATVARHTGLGAEVIGEGPRWTVLRDPAGMRYCVTDRSPATGVLAPRGR